MKLIARDREIENLTQYYNSNQSEFVALYGRRRVGKTFLIRNYFNDQFAFFVTGIIEGNKKEQMTVFHQALTQYGYTGDAANNWLEAFAQLAQLLKQKKRTTKKRLVVFIDELPCFDTKNSGFVRALGHFWNTTGVAMDRLMLIVCGSATSWMINKVVNNHGGLHNRITHTMHLKPFTLFQTEQYVRAKRSTWDRMSILQMYMALGGIPFYLSKIDFDQSATDNIDRLLFAENGDFRNEYHRLFQSLYRHPEVYMDVIRLLSDNKKGLTRKQIADTLSIPNNGHLSQVLSDLAHCDFIRAYGNGKKLNQMIYQVIDFYTLFYNQFLAKRITDQHYWRNHLGTPKQNTWYGFTFERVCQCHINQIIRALHLDSIHVEYYSWRSRESTPGAQIDLIIDRADGIITMCEIKYSKTQYTLTKAEYDKILNRIECFMRETHSRKGIQTVIVTTQGLKPHGYAEIASKSICLDDLFEHSNN